LITIRGERVVEMRPLLGGRGKREVRPSHQVESLRLSKGSERELGKGMLTLPREAGGKKNRGAPGRVLVSKKKN